MAFSRTMYPEVALRGEELASTLVGIGMNFAGEGDSEANIEDGLLFASEAGMLEDDLRILSVVVSWLGVHSRWINADRLIRIVREHEHSRVRAFWAGVGRWLGNDVRFGRLQRVYEGPTVSLLTVGNAFQIRRHGEDPRFGSGPLRVPAKVLRDRPGDVLSPTELCRQHRAYYLRVMMGPTYRADMWAELEASPSLSPADLARRTYGSFATAWQVKRDFALCQGST